MAEQAITNPHPSFPKEFLEVLKEEFFYDAETYSSRSCIPCKNFDVYTTFWVGIENYRITGIVAQFLRFDIILHFSRFLNEILQNLHILIPTFCYIFGLILR